MHHIILTVSLIYYQIPVSDEQNSDVLPDFPHFCDKVWKMLFVHKECFMFIEYLKVGLWITSFSPGAHLLPPPSIFFSSVCPSYIFSVARSWPIVSLPFSVRWSVILSIRRNITLPIRWPITLSTRWSITLSVCWSVTFSVRWTNPPLLYWPITGSVGWSIALFVLFPVSRLGASPVSGPRASLVPRSGPHPSVLLFRLCDHVLEIRQVGPVLLLLCVAWTTVLLDRTLDANKIKLKTKVGMRN